MISPHLPHLARIVDRVQESDTIFTLHMRFNDPATQAEYAFRPGQFNMVYLPGAGEVPISLSSDPEEKEFFSHTIRVAGRVTKGIDKLGVGEEIGVRGPYGHGWPLESSEGKDVIIVTGGLGCAPVVAVIHYVLKRRNRFRRLIILQGVKHSHDLIWRASYERWAQAQDTQVLIAANATEAIWPWHIGSPIDLVNQAEFDPENAVAMICGPEGMIVAAAKSLARRGLPEADIHVSLERNMQCALGLCGHCQLGDKFLCRDGPVFAYPEVKSLLERGGL